MIYKRTGPMSVSLRLFDYTRTSHLAPLDLSNTTTRKNASNAPMTNAKTSKASLRRPLTTRSRTPSLRVMLALAESYHALSSNKCNCFQPGDTCDRRRMSTAALNTSDNKDQEPEEEARPSDDLDWPSLSPNTGLKISQEDWFQYHNRGFVFG